jgi:hypothetical protein
VQKRTLWLPVKSISPTTKRIPNREPSAVLLCQVQFKCGNGGASSSDVGSLPTEELPAWPFALVLLLWKPAERWFERRKPQEVAHGHSHRDFDLVRHVRVALGRATAIIKAERGYDKTRT